MLPKVVRLPGVIGTVAMLLVGGGMFVHNLEWVYHVPGTVPSFAADLVAGLIVGSGLLLLTRMAKTIRRTTLNDE